MRDLCVQCITGAERTARGAARAHLAAALAAVLGIVVSCGGGGAAAPEARPAATPAPPEPRPPAGLPEPPPESADLRLSADGRREAAYRLELEIRGSHWSPRERSSSRERVHEEYALELHFRRRPVAAPEPGSMVSVLLLDALRFTRRQDPPGRQREIELADDRLRVMEGEKPVLRRFGSVPGSADEVSPGRLLGRPFYLLRHDLDTGAHRSRSRLSTNARRVLREVPISSALEWTLAARPTRSPVAPGDRWSAIRTPPTPPGALGLTLELQYELVAFEEVQGVGCAVVSITGGRETPPEGGHERLSDVSSTVSGTLWLDLRRARVQRLTLDESTKASVATGPPSAGGPRRFDYESRADLRRLPGPVSTERWADGTKRFR